MSIQVTALPLYGGIRLRFAIGAVVVGLPTTFQTPLSGQISPVFAVVPIGAREVACSISISFLAAGIRPRGRSIMYHYIYRLRLSTQVAYNRQIILTARRAAIQRAASIRGDA